MTWVDAWIDPYSDYYGEFIPVPSGPAIAIADPWKIYVRDPAYQRQAEIDELVDFQATLRFNNVDTWLLTLNSESPNVDLLNQPGWGIEVRYKGASPPVLSGPQFGFIRNWNANPSLNVDNVQFNGFSDDLHIAGRVVQQTPGQSYTYGALFQFLTNYDAPAAARAETLIKHFVDVNIGPGATADRRLAGLSITADQGRGTILTEQGRMQQLIALLQTIALSGGDIGFHLKADPVNGAVFDVFTPTDRSQTVKVSEELQNLINFKYNVQGPTANVVYEGSQQAGASRYFMVVEDAPSVATWGRYEVFTDERDTQDANTLASRAATTLAQNGVQTSSQAQPDLEQGGAVFVDDWQLGDAVTLVIDGQPVVEKIREVTFTINSQGVNVTLGQAAGGQTPPGPPWHSLQRRLATRIRNLERS